MINIDEIQNELWASVKSDMAKTDDWIAMITSCLFWLAFCLVIIGVFAQLNFSLDFGLIHIVG